MPKLHIYLFRHGQTTYNRDVRFTGQDNPELTREGVKESKIIAKKLKNKKIQLAFHTPLVRSKQTLKQILRYHPDCEVFQDDRMMERDYGALSGMKHQEFVNKVGKKLLRLDFHGDMYAEISSKEKKKLTQVLGKQEFEIIHRSYEIAPPHGESLAQVEKRVASFIQDLKILMKKSKCNVAIAAHGNSIRMFRKIMERASVKQALSWTIPHTKVYTYTISF